MRLLIMGPQGVGKGTQAALLAEHFNIPTISTGNLLRAAMQQGTELGKQVKEAMDAGKLVSDELIIQLVKERLGQEDCKNGYLLDGFPRTLAQAKALSGFAKIDGALSIEVSDSEIEHRMDERVGKALGILAHLRRGVHAALASRRQQGDRRYTGPSSCRNFALTVMVSGRSMLYQPLYLPSFL